MVSTSRHMEDQCGTQSKVNKNQKQTQLTVTLPKIQSFASCKFGKGACIIHCLS